MDGQMAEIEGNTFGGLYVCYQGRYLYSWDTPYFQYAGTGHVATERQKRATAAPLLALSKRMCKKAGPLSPAFPFIQIGPDSEADKGNA